MSDWRKKSYLEQKVDEYMNRKPLEYDMEKDPAYQRYRDQYNRMGKLSAEDAMGVATASTGGYANTYAQTAANNAYREKIDQFNSLIPDLVSNAQSRYTAAGDKMLDDISLVQSMQNQYGTVAEDYVSTDNIKSMQRYLGVDDDGLWGPISTKAAGGLSAADAWKKYKTLIQ